MNDPIRRADEWWTRTGSGSWMRYDDAAGEWKAAAAPPPPPPPPPPSASPSVAEAPGVAIAGSLSSTFVAAPVGEIGLAPESEVRPRSKPLSERVSIKPSWLAGGALAVLAVIAAFILLGGGEKISAADAFVPLAGYEYQDLPEEQMGPVQDLLENTPLFSEYIREFDARSITRSGVPAAFAFSLAMEDDAFDTMDRTSMLGGFQATSGAQLRQDRVAGMEAYRADMLGASVVLFIDPAGLIVQVVGTDRATVNDVAQQLATGAEARGGADS